MKNLLLSNLRFLVMTVMLACSLPCVMASSSRYAKIKKAWIEHDVTSAGQRGMYLHFGLTIGGMKRRTVAISSEITLDSEIAGEEPELVGCYNLNYEPTNNIETYSDYKIFISYDQTEWREGDNQYFLNLLLTDADSGEELNEPGSTILPFCVKFNDRSLAVSYDEDTENIKRVLGLSSSESSSQAASATTPSASKPQSSSTQSAQGMTEEQKLLLEILKERTMKVLDVGDGNYIVILRDLGCADKNLVSMCIWVPRDFKHYASTKLEMEKQSDYFKKYGHYESDILIGPMVCCLVDHQPLFINDFYTVYVFESGLLVNGNAYDVDNPAHKGRNMYTKLEERRISLQAGDFLKQMYEGKNATLKWPAKFNRIITTTRSRMKNPKLEQVRRDDLDFNIFKTEFFDGD